jgi:hypothetical protein
LVGGVREAILPAMRYSAYVSERYDDEPPTNLHRIAGAPIGLATSDWPRFRGRPMQHAFTIDLAGLELQVPRAAEARALAVFVDSYYELDAESSEGIAVVWLTQAQIDAHGQTTPPADFEPELRPNRETMDEDGHYYENGEPMLELEPLEDDEDGDFGDSWIGGRPNWGEAGEPARVPPGAFVMQVMSHAFPICRTNACLFVFEGGAILRAEYPDDRRPLPWPEAIAASREVVVLDQPPPEGALQKWGGRPRGVDQSAWPRGLSHIMTWVPERKPDDCDAVAYALFGRLSKRDNWEDELSFYQVQEITAAELEAWDPDEEIEEAEQVEQLDERALELREFSPDTSWRDLQTRSFLGPRPAWRAPDRRSAREFCEGTVLQLTDELLPVSPGRGTLHAPSDGYPIWHPAYGAPQATRERPPSDGTLYAEDTTAAIVVGWHFKFPEFSVVPERVEMLEQTLQAALAIRGQRLRLFVPGDTSTDRNAEVYGGFVLGREVIAVEANDYDAGPVDLQTIATALAELPELDESFWREALAFAGIEAPDEPRAYLLSWGPLCYGAIYAGVAATRSDTAMYKFIANQDMHQEWSQSGVDGVHLQSTEFSEIRALEVTQASLDVAAKLDGASFWLICRYD